jgi:hypothetical protein
MEKDGKGRTITRLYGVYLTNKIAFTINRRNANEKMII